MLLNKKLFKCTNNARFKYNNSKHIPKHLEPNKPSQPHHTTGEDIVHIHKIIMDKGLSEPLRLELAKEYCTLWALYPTYQTRLDIYKRKYDYYVAKHKYISDTNNINNTNNSITNIKNIPNTNDDMLNLILKQQEHTKQILMNYYNKLKNMSRDEKNKRLDWMDYILKLPTEHKKINLDNNNLDKIKQSLNKEIFRMEHAKDDLLSAIYSYVQNPNSENNTIALYGAPGAGKTALVRLIALCTDIPFVQVSVGNINDANYLIGSSYTYQHSEPGYLVKSIIRLGYKNGIIFFDEIDKLSDGSRGNEILGTLMHLCDTTQNSTFEDKYLGDVPIDFSNYLFVYSLNNIEKMSPALLSRIGQNIIKIDNYSLDDKIEIATKYIIPKYLLDTEIVFKKEIISYIITDCIPTSGKGIRELKAQIKKIIRMVRYYNTLKPNEYPYPVVLDKKMIDYILNKSEITCSTKYIL